MVADENVLLSIRPVARSEETGIRLTLADLDDPVRVEAEPRLLPY